MRDPNLEGEVPEPSRQSNQAARRGIEYGSGSGWFVDIFKSNLDGFYRGVKMHLNISDV